MLIRTLIILLTALLSPTLACATPPPSTLNIELEHDGTGGGTLFLDGSLSVGGGLATLGVGTTLNADADNPKPLTILAAWAHGVTRTVYPEWRYSYWGENGELTTHGAALGLTIQGDWGFAQVAPGLRYITLTTITGAEEHITSPGVSAALLGYHGPFSLLLIAAGNGYSRDMGRIETSRSISDKVFSLASGLSRVTVGTMVAFDTRITRHSLRYDLSQAAVDQARTQVLSTGIEWYPGRRSRYGLELGVISGGGRTGYIRLSSGILW